MNEYWNFVDCNIVERSTEEIVELIKKLILVNPYILQFLN